MTKLIKTSIPSISYMGQCWIDMIPESQQTVHYAVIEEFVTIQAQQCFKVTIPDLNLNF